MTGVIAPSPWQVIVPVKQPGAGKTRLPVPTGARALLAEAFAADTIAAAAALVGAARVLVVGFRALGRVPQRHLFDGQVQRGVLKRLGERNVRDWL